MSGSAILTNNGLLKIASASPLDQLTITQIAIGDGVNPLDPNSTALVNEVYRDAASTPIRSTTYPNTLVFELNIPPTTGGFTCREIGAFDTDGDLIAVGTLDELVKPTDGINYVARINVKLANAAQIDVFYDNQGAIDHSGLRNRDADNVHTANAIEGLEFDTVAEVVAYTKIDKLVGRRVWIGDRQAWFKVVLTSSIVPDSGARYIESISNPLYTFSLDVNQPLKAKSFGCVIGQDNSPYINVMVNSDSVVEIDDDYEFTDITVKTSSFFTGKGTLTGLNAAGAKPTKAQLDATDSAGRLALLQTHRPNSVEVVSDGDNTFYPKKITNATITPQGVSGAIELNGKSELKNCAFHSISLNSSTGSSCLADNLVMSDVSGYGVYALHGGSIDAPNCLVYNCERGFYTFEGGTISAPDSEVYASTGIQVFANGGGTIRMPRSTVQDGALAGLKCDYTSHIQIADGIIDNNGGAAVSSESNSSIFALRATITNNGAWALVTSFNGFIQCVDATISNNGNAAIPSIPAIETLNGGFIDILGSTVTADNSANTDGYIIKSSANGFIMSENGGIDSKSALTPSQYNPPYGIIGNGTALIYNSRTSDEPYPDSVIGIMNNQKSTSRRKQGVVTGNSIEIDSSWVLVDDTSPVVINDIQLAVGFFTDEIVIQPTGGGGGVTIEQSGSGNVRLGAAKVLAGANKITKLYKTEFSNLWLGVE